MSKSSERELGFPPAHLGALQGVDSLTAKQLIREYGPEAARWASAQRELRARARAKFDEPGRMLFVKEALEQASHASVAGYHASRFPPGVLVADLTAGIGGDALEMARRGPVIAYELDPERASCLAHNCQGFDVEIRQGSCLEATDLPDHLWADPSRRDSQGNRIAKLSDYEPNPATLSERAEARKLVGIKLSPLVPNAELIALSRGQEVEFVSFGRECKEATVWRGAAAESRWSAYHVESGERLACDPDDYPPLPSESPDAWLFDADPAAIRAGALAELCKRYSLRPLGDSPGYLTGPSPIDSVWLRGYRVRESLPGDLRKLEHRLKSERWHLTEIKQRGAGLDDQRLRKQLRTPGTPVTLVAWRVGKSLRLAVTEPRTNLS